MNLDQFNALTALVRESKARERQLWAQSEAASAAWKAANAELTDRQKVLDSFVKQQTDEATAL